MAWSPWAAVPSVSFMSEPTRYSTAPIELPLDDWLYAANPVEGCAECAEAMGALEAARRRGDASARFAAARTVRSHPHRGGVS